MDETVWDSLQKIADEMKVTRNRLIEHWLKQCINRHYLILDKHKDQEGGKSEL
jgi:hypothetical protein